MKFGYSCFKALYINIFIAIFKKKVTCHISLCTLKTSLSLYFSLIFKKTSLNTKKRLRFPIWGSVRKMRIYNAKPIFLMAFLYSHDQIHKKQTCLTQKLNVDRSFLGFDFYVFWIIGYYIHHVTAPSPFIKVLKRVFLHDSLRNGISKFENQMEKS